MTDASGNGFIFSFFCIFGAALCVLFLGTGVSPGTRPELSSSATNPRRRVMVYLKLVFGVALLARRAFARGMVRVERATLRLGTSRSHAGHGTGSIHRWRHVAADGWLVVYVGFDVGFC